MKRARSSLLSAPCTLACVASFGALLAFGTASGCGDGSSLATPSIPDPSGGDGGDGTSSGDPGTEGGTTSSGGPVLPDGAPILGPDNVTIIVEPTDKAQAVLSAIQAAKSSVHLTMYLMNDQRFIDALIAQHNAGHDVKVLLNKTFPMNAGTNQKAFTALQAGGVAVQWAPSSFTLTHEKAVVIDAKSAWIMTMNLENTSSSNREYVALDQDPGDVQEAEAVFAADFANTAYVPSGNLLVAPVNARDRLLQLVQSAKSTIDLEGEELSDYKIVDALGAAQKAGVKVRIVLADTAPAASQTSAVNELKADGIQLVSVSDPYIHAKALVVDGKAAYVGSENFTTGSLQYNRELGLITVNAAAAALVGQTIAKDFAAGTAL